MSNKSIEQNAFVLHSRPFQEHQHLVELLTEHQGKMSALVYVGQSKRSIKKALIQPFIPLKITFNGHQQTLKRIQNIETIHKSYPLVKEHLYSAFYLNELLVRLLKDDVQYEELFLPYQNTLKALSQSLPIAPQLRYFEINLLAELGLSFDFSPVFDENSDNVVGFYYLPEQGFVPAYQYSVHSINTRWYLREHIQAIAMYIGNDVPIEDIKVQHTFKVLMRAVINHLLDGKPLNSRNLFKN